MAPCSPPWPTTWPRPACAGSRSASTASTPPCSAPCAAVTASVPTLSTEGQLVTCLFAAGGLDLRGPMRDGASDEELRDLIAGCWSNRRDRYSEERSQLTIRPRRRVEMFQVGG